MDVAVGYFPAVLADLTAYALDTARPELMFRRAWWEGAPSVLASRTDAHNRSRKRRTPLMP